MLQLAPRQSALLLLTAKLRVDMRHAGDALGVPHRDETPVHKAADAHLNAMTVATMYAFLKGRQAYKSGGAKAAVAAVHAGLLRSLPPVLAKVFVAGANAGVGMLPKRRAAEMRAAYSPDQERDSHGRFGPGGGTSDGGVPHDGQVSQAGLDKRFPVAGETVDGLTIPDFHDSLGPDVPNMSSISASLNDYEIQDGVREVKVSDFEDNGKPSFYSTTEEARVKDLAEQIKESKSITPLIVVVDKDGAKGPYILEGGHRFDALKLIGKKSFPALVVVDTEHLKILSMRAAAPFDIRFDVADPAAVKWAREHTSKIADDISQTSKDRINEAIAQALEGDGLDAAYDDILAAVGDEARADMIARTEVMDAANQGALAGFSQAQDEGLLPEDATKVWIASSDACDDCEELDGEEAPMDEDFSSGDDAPPAHPNCRCSIGVGTGGA